MPLNIPSSSLTKLTEDIETRGFPSEIRGRWERLVSEAVVGSDVVLCYWNNNPDLACEREFVVVGDVSVPDDSTFFINHDDLPQLIDSWPTVRSTLERKGKIRREVWSFKRSK